MNSTSLHQFRAILEQRKSDVLAQIARADQQARASAERPTDPGDQSAATLDREFLFAQADTNRRLLRSLEQALARIRQGTFGECEQCGNDISPARLRAIPWTRNCVACQEKLEYQHRVAA